MRRTVCVNAVVAMFAMVYDAANPPVYSPGANFRGESRAAGALGDLGRDIPSSYFAVQHLTAVFDDSLERVRNYAWRSRPTWAGLRGNFSGYTASI